MSGRLTWAMCIESNCIILFCKAEFRRQIILKSNLAFLRVNIKAFKRGLLPNLM